MKSEKAQQLYDLVIIGGAAVGCAAAVYAARRGLNFIVVTKDIGGEVALSGVVDNWPGTIHTDGVKLAQDFHQHALSYGVQFDTGYEITGIAPPSARAQAEGKQNHHVVTAVNDNGETKEYKTKTVIIGSGIHPRKLGIPGEDALKGKGITSCTVCDGPLFKNKTTVTIGAGNSALESALMMTGIAKKVYVITKYPDTKETAGGFPKGEFILVDKVKKLPNVEIIYSASTKEILGDAKVTGLVYEDIASKKPTTIDTDAVMVHIGMIPNSSFAKNLKQNPLGEILVDKLGKTSEPGIFAGGDVTDVPYKQIAIAAGQGVTAALSAIDYINKWSE